MARIRLRDFRNYSRLDAAFSPGFHVVLGNNAQGKTNLLEAVYLMATLRSFRGVGSAQMIRHGATGYFVGGKVIGPTEHEIRMHWAPGARKLTLDNQPVRKLTEYYGALRAVVFCTEDLQLVKGTSRFRRRFLDLLLAQTHAPYLGLLQRYAKALRARNALLKRHPADELALDSFSHELVAAGRALIQLRQALLPEIAPLVCQAYGRIAQGADSVRLECLPAIKQDLGVELAQSRARERTLRTTVIGPYRDDLALLLNDRPAAQFGSEGQKRTLAIALKMAQAEFFASRHGAPPILLLDDVMGELDARRRAGLLPLLERAHHAQGQVFMTCTEENWPQELGRDLHRWQVEGGKLKAA